MAVYKSRYQGEGGIFKANEKTSGQTYYGKKKKDAPFLDPSRIVDFFLGKKKKT
jgi:hypothetical protein